MIKRHITSAALQDLQFLCRTLNLTKRGLIQELWFLFRVLMVWI